ncbi:MAG: TetR/AcrR family transcriptional regulator [Deltaproteobacteria bacterium]|nr:TetR/AcrR family transcriptional regulator [Deltaproteobacteria bacterium]
MNRITLKGNKKVRELLIQNEVKQKRETFMLEQARKIGAAEGLHALTIPRLAEETGYSKPTVYKYFPTKEDLIVAIAAQSSAIRASYYERAVTFQARPREKLYGFNALNFGFLHPYFREMLDLHVNRLSHQAGKERQKELYENENRVVEIIAGVVREAIENGDLKLPEKVDEYQIIFTLSSTTFGGYVMRESDSPVMKKWFDRIRFKDGVFGEIVLDGLGWKPLSTEWNYGKTKKRFFREVFPELLDDSEARRKASG